MLTPLPTSDPRARKEAAHALEELRDALGGDGIASRLARALVREGIPTLDALATLYREQGTERGNAFILSIRGQGDRAVERAQKALALPPRRRDPARVVVVYDIHTLSDLLEEGREGRPLTLRAQNGEKIVFHPGDPRTGTLTDSDEAGLRTAHLATWEPAAQETRSPGPPTTVRSKDMTPTRAAEHSRSHVLQQAVSARESSTPGARSCPAVLPHELNPTAERDGHEAR